MQQPLWARVRGAAAWLVLAAVLALAWIETSELRRLLRDTAPTRGQLATDSAFYASPILLGDNEVILRAVQEVVPRGEPIAVDGGDGFEQIKQRFWLALLPTWPIAADAEWLLCPNPCGRPEDTLMAGGGQYSLIRRASPAP
jgi:hypothetical protein